jgi:antitoxin VapB
MVVARQGAVGHSDLRAWTGRTNYGILPTEGRILQSLNLKNPRAYSLASELSHLTGESLTSAVITSLEQRLDAERRKRDGRTTSERILAFAHRFAQGIPPDIRSADHADLYGDDGMPR